MCNVALAFQVPHRSRARGLHSFHALQNALVERLKGIKLTHDMLTAKQNEMATSGQRGQHVDISKQRASLDRIVYPYMEWLEVGESLREAEQVAAMCVQETTPDTVLEHQAMVEIEALNRRLLVLEDTILGALVPEDENDDRNVMLEVRQGTGGDEACLWAKELLSAYIKYIDSLGWKCSVISDSPGPSGGMRFEERQSLKRRDTNFCELL